MATTAAHAVFSLNPETVDDWVASLAPSCGSLAWKLLCARRLQQAGVIMILSNIRSDTEDECDLSARSGETLKVRFEQPTFVNELAFQTHATRCKTAVPSTLRQRAPTTE